MISYFSWYDIKYDITKKYDKIGVLTFLTRKSMISYMISYTISKDIDTLPMKLSKISRNFWYHWHYTWILRMISKNLWYLSHMISYFFDVIMSPGEIFKLKLEIPGWKIFKLKNWKFQAVFKLKFENFKLFSSLNLKISSCFLAETWDF